MLVAFANLLQEAAEAKILKSLMASGVSLDSINRRNCYEILTKIGNAAIP
jgi:hypothetical protein